MRGQRVFCSDRGERGGCGKTFAVFLADILPRHTVRATLFWQLLCQWLAGLSVKAAAESLRLPWALETFYRLWRQLEKRAYVLRPLLCQKQAPPPADHREPLRHTLKHLQSLFALAACPLQEFQLVFECPLLG